jgi:glycerol kinase
MTVVAIDAGTTGVRAFAVDDRGQPCGWSYREFPQHFPRPGWVEHDADDIWNAVTATLAELAATLHRCAATAEQGRAALAQRRAATEPRGAPDAPVSE